MLKVKQVKFKNKIFVAEISLTNFMKFLKRIIFIFVLISFFQNQKDDLICVAQTH